ncbi:MAG: Photosystem I assembly protein Ycf3 [Chlamydiae bacterium]|nr:Photosystem I assembly protein Ycf3 [Chlamydiota bacterium]
MDCRKNPGFLYFHTLQQVCFMEFNQLNTATLKSDPEKVKNPEELVASGENKLLQGHFSEAMEAFSEVEELIQDSQPELYFRKGLALFDYGSEEGRQQALLIANKKFKKAHQLDPHSPEILQVWGNTLTHLGDQQGEYHFFVSAKEKYEKALGLQCESAELFWDYGVSWYHMGTHSEEAVDLQKAVQYFERAIEYAETLPLEFWVDYGATALLLSTKIKDLRQIVKAVNCFKHAVSLDESHADSWSSLAEALQMLFEHTHDEDHFSQANDCFATASKLCPQEPEHWLEWAKFLLASARQSGDLKRLRACLEKCHYAYACDPEIPTTLAIWAEALALLGQLTERLDLIYEAENKIEEALELDEDDPEIWYSLGMCFNSFGRYFNDFDHYYQAIEKFQIGLSIDRTHDPLWHAIANTYSTVGAIEDNIDTLLQSLKFYEKALAISSTSTRHIDYAKTLSKMGEMIHDQNWLEQSLYHFEVAFWMQKNAVYLHPEWLFSYASTLDMLGDFHDDEKYYTRAIELFSHVLMVDPDFPEVHHRLAQAFCHLGELTGEIDYFYRAIHHLRLALKREDDNDYMILDWGIALIHIAQHTPVLTDVEQLMQDAKQKLTLAAKLGNIQAFYQLTCLYSILQNPEKAIYFLKKADYFNALPPLEELQSDDWLDHLRSTSEFREFLAAHPNLQE